MRLFLIIISSFSIARRSILLDTQHPDGLEKIRELEAQGRPARLEVEEPPVTPPRFVTELRVNIFLKFISNYFKYFQSIISCIVNFKFIIFNSVINFKFLKFFNIIRKIF